jgi:hypothetical protein
MQGICALALKSSFIRKLALAPVFPVFLSTLHTMALYLVSTYEAYFGVRQGEEVGRWD